MFGDILKQLRKKKKLTQGDLCAKLGTSRSTISMYELGERMPDYDTMKNIASIFGVSMDYLYEKEKPADDDELTDIERTLLEFFRQIPEDQQKHFLEMGRAYANSLKKD